MREPCEDPVGRLRALAERFREAAAETHWPDYIALFEVTAGDLDRLAVETERPTEPCCAPRLRSA